MRVTKRLRERLQWVVYPCFGPWDAEDEFETVVHWASLLEEGYLK
jgi:hypothetical protein